MAWLPALYRNLVRRRSIDHELDEELRAILDLLIEDKTRAGLSPAEARRAALIELGRVESVKQRVREGRRGALLDTVLQDTSYALRILIRNPVFTVSAALSLALGIGATTAVFTVANGLLLRAATGVREAERLVDLARRPPGGDPGVEAISYPDLLDVRASATSFEEVYGYQILASPASFGIGDGTMLAYPTLVTTNYFRALGVGPVIGRVFDRSDSDLAGASPVAVLSHGFWTRQLAGDPRVVGQTIRYNTIPVTIIGVAAEGFKGLSVVAPDAWLPVGLVIAQSPETGGRELRERVPWLALGARLKDGVSRQRASAEIAIIGARIQRTATPPPFLPAEAVSDQQSLVWSAERASPIPFGMRTVVAGFVGLLLAVVSTVLVIACANLAGVLLARATGRRREIAVRTAVGAAPSRVVRQMLTETVILFALGGAAGLVLARTLTTLLIRLLPEFPIPLNVSAPLDGRVVAFAGGLSFVAALASGLAPALHAARSDVITALKSETQGPLDRHRLRQVFVVLQVALSILLVVVAGLLVRRFDSVLASRSGIDLRGVSMVSLDLSMGGFTQATGPDVVERLVEQVLRIPGVTSATAADRGPNDGGRVFGQVVVPGVSPPQGTPEWRFNWTLSRPGYFRTLGVRIAAGRDFVDADREGAEPVAIVGARTAERLWPGQDAVGRFLSVTPTTAPVQAPPRSVRIVGVVADNSLGASLSIYVPWRQWYVPQVAILAKVGPEEPGAAPAMQAAVSAVDGRLPVLEARSLEFRADGPVETQLRIAATVAGVVGAAGLLLAAIGIYGVAAYAVAQRTREIGIRLALGADTSDVVRMVLTHGMRLVGIGCGIGLVLSLAAGRVLSARQFGVPRFDPATLVMATLLFVVVGLVACYVPVRRAARIRSIEALRYE